MFTVIFVVAVSFFSENNTKSSDITAFHSILLLKCHCYLLFSAEFFYSICIGMLHLKPLRIEIDKIYTSFQTCLEKKEYATKYVQNYIVRCTLRFQNVFVERKKKTNAAYITASFESIE